MSKLLYVIASPQPASHSFSRKVSEAFLSAYRETHPADTIDVLDLWTEPMPEFGALAASWKVKSMTGGTHTPEELAEISAVQRTIDRFLSADKYLFSIPMWNFTIPYKLKHFIDTIVQPGRTFGFDPARGYFGLVPGDRKVQMVVSSGGSYAAGTPMAQFDNLRPYMAGVLGFIGLTNVETITVDCTAFGPAVSDPVLAASLATAMKAGAAF